MHSGICPEHQSVGSCDRRLQRRRCAIRFCTVKGNYGWNKLALPLLEGYDRGDDKNQVNYEVAQGVATRYYLYSQQWDKACEIIIYTGSDMTLGGRTCYFLGDDDFVDNATLSFNEDESALVLSNSFYTVTSEYEAEDWYEAATELVKQ